MVINKEALEETGKVRSVLLGEKGRKGNSDEVIYLCTQAPSCATS